jgi:hypothetical protein
MVAHTCHPSYVEAEVDIGRIVVPGQSGQKSSQDLHLNRKSWVRWHVPVIPATAGRINRRIEVQDGLGKKTLSQKKKKKKKKRI